MSVVRNLSIETAPRDPNELGNYAMYPLLKLGEQLKLAETPEAASAWAKTTKGERVTRLIEALRLVDAQNGGAPAQQVRQPVQQVLVPQQPQATVSVGVPAAPAVSGRKPRTSSSAQAAAASPAAPVQQNFTFDPGVLSAVHEAMQVIKGNTEAAAQTSVSFAKQLEAIQAAVQENNLLLRMLVWMLPQLAEGVDPQEFINDAVKAAETVNVSFKPGKAK